MAYARFGAEGSDVYVFLDNHRVLRCQRCALELNGDFTADSTAKMVTHLERHQAQGQVVPDSCTEDLLRDAESNDAWLRGETDDI